MNTQDKRNGTPSRGTKPIGGNGRLATLAVLDRVLAKHSNQQELEVAFERALRENPTKFFLAVVAPLLPSQALRLLSAVRALDVLADGTEKTDAQSLHQLCGDLVALRKADQSAARLELELDRERNRWR